MTSTVFVFDRGINGTKILTKFHEDLTRNVAPRETKFNVLTKFHENWAKNVTKTVENCPPTGGHVFSPIWTIFTLFHDDWANIVTSRVQTAPPTGSHVFQRNGTTFELNQHIIKTNI
ncbi:hypothetical protein DPMN_066379 [Dreissena polymorpha]|uniref:Uncharacterized protein n=1 Tax=Dreissena polymorpha TaxID=45954 RepID=A0A9D3YTD9_DREPO|nr:hypothetical protein DPMN_066379 [Dreissena polymorpha]